MSVKKQRADFTKMNQFAMVLYYLLIFSCQTYEGGFSGCPGLEAHGGYAFCGLASLVMLRKGHLCDLQALLVMFFAIYTLHILSFFKYIEMGCKQTNEI